MGLMMSTRFAHLSPKQLVPQLADRGLYLASESTFYRLQRRYGLRTRRRTIARTDISRATTLHRACGPNQVWSWDITWLATTVRGLYLHLYLVLDVWSRRIVGWCIAERGSAEIAAELITHACREGNFDPKGLVLTPTTANRCAPVLSSQRCNGLGSYRPSADRMSRMTIRTPRRCSARSNTRRPIRGYPFESLAGAQRWMTGFAAWYNGMHRHSALRDAESRERIRRGEYLIRRPLS